MKYIAIAEEGFWARIQCNHLLISANKSIAKKRDKLWEYGGQNWRAKHGAKVDGKTRGIPGGKIMGRAEVQKAASMASVPVLIFPPAVFIFGLPTRKSC